MRKHCKKLIASIALSLMLFNSAGLSFAETSGVGSIIKEAENGWKRYDDSYENIKYYGGWTLGYDPQCYSGKLYFVYENENKTDKKVKFNFTGDKLRIISVGIEPYNVSTTVKIDNKIIETFKPGTTGLNSISYEKLGLTYGEHSVEISYDNSYLEKRIGIDAIDIDEKGEIKPYNEEILTTTAASLDMKASKDKVRVGEVFTVDAMLKNVSNVYATDFKVNYNNTLFEFAGYEEIPGYKVYNKPVDDNGNIRFIVASQGKTFPMNNEVNVVKLKFRAKSPGLGKVDALKGRLADTEKEFDLDELNCLEDEILVEAAKDVNRTGEYTLLDLSIDAYYFGMDSKDTDKTKHDADQDLNEKVDDVDLTIIVNQILENKNYKPNN